MERESSRQYQYHVRQVAERYGCLDQAQSFNEETGAYQLSSRRVEANHQKVQHYHRVS